MSNLAFDSAIDSLASRLAEGNAESVEQGRVEQGKSGSRVDFDMESKSEQTPVPVSTRQALSQIAELILMADVRVTPHEDPEVTAERVKQARGLLAIRLGCNVEDINEIVESYGDQWDEMVLFERVKRGLESAESREISWDRLETAVLRKLSAVVEQGLVTTVSELLAVAKTANQAMRRHTMPAGGNGSRNGNGPRVTMEFPNAPAGGDPENGVLPSGDLGTITLTLTQRIHKQIEGTAERVDEGRTLKDLEMLTISEVQEVGESLKQSE